MFRSSYIASLVQISEAVIDRLRVASSLVVGTAPDELTIDSDGIRLPVDDGVPQDLSTIEWYSPASGDWTARLRSLVTAFLATVDVHLEIADPGSPWTTTLNLTSPRGDVVLDGSRSVQIVAGSGPLGQPSGAIIDADADVRVTAGGDVIIDADASLILAGDDVDVAGPPAASSQHAAGYTGSAYTVAGTTAIGNGTLLGNGTAFTARAGRRYRVDACIYEWTPGAVGDLWQFDVERAQDGSILARCRHRGVSTASGGDGTVVWSDTFTVATARAVNPRIRFTRVTGGVNGQIAPLPPFPAFLCRIYDDGPA